MIRNRQSKDRINNSQIKIDISFSCLELYFKAIIHVKRSWFYWRWIVKSFWLSVYCLTKEELIKESLEACCSLVLMSHLAGFSYKDVWKFLASYFCEQDQEEVLKFQDFISLNLLLEENNLWLIMEVWTVLPFYQPNMRLRFS